MKCPNCAGPRTERECQYCGDRVEDDKVYPKFIVPDSTRIKYYSDTCIRYEGDPPSMLEYCEEVLTR